MIWKFFRRLFCRHRWGKLQSIEWDGTAVYKCACCEKFIYRGLGR